MNFKDFWYIVAESSQLAKNQVLRRELLDERLVIFRDKEKKAAVLRDRCLHRAAPLSLGKVRRGELQCAYHGWTYSGCGRVTGIPSMAELNGFSQCRVPSYPVIEQEGYIYVRLTRTSPFTPFSIPHYGEKNWRHIRLRNLFPNNVRNCVENFVDIPHTAYVHDGVFRSRKNQPIRTKIVRQNGSVSVSYRNESSNLGLFSWFLNPFRREILHEDNFHMPNVTCVTYSCGPRRHFIITSQSVPVSRDETLVYTDLTYDYGIWNHAARWFIKKQAKTIIDQDIDILRAQMETITRYGGHFMDTPADSIHALIDSIRNEIEQGRDPRDLPEVTREICFEV